MLQSLVSRIHRILALGLSTLAPAAGAAAPAADAPDDVPTTLTDEAPTAGDGAGARAAGAPDDRQHLAMHLAYAQSITESVLINIHTVAARLVRAFFFELNGLSDGESRACSPTLSPQADLSAAARGRSQKGACTTRQQRATVRRRDRLRVKPPAHLFPPKRTAGNCRVQSVATAVVRQIHRRKVGMQPPQLEAH